MLVALPPALDRWSIARPKECPRCGHEGGIAIHQRTTRRIPYLVEGLTESDIDMIGSYHSVRFRCRSCRGTFSTPLPGKASGFRLDKHVQARIVFWYLFGYIPSKIAALLRWRGVVLSHSTIERVLHAADDGNLRTLHKYSRLRRRWAAKRGNAFQWYSAPDTPSPYRTFGQNVLAPALVVEDDPTVVILHNELFLFFLYGDLASRVTATWLELYLDSLSVGGIRTFQSLAQIDKEFASREPLRGQLQYERFYLTGESENAKTNWQMALNRDAVRSLVRIAEIESRTNRGAEEENVKWKNRRASFWHRDTPDEDLFDET